MFFEGTAWAQAAAQSATSEQNILTTVVPLALLFVVFYFLLIRPQTQKAREHDKMIKDLKRNDEVVTTGGLIGRIVEIGDKVLTLEIAPNIRVRVERTGVSSISAHGKTSAKKD
jgi:preprotein translocase subunit YajC